MGIPGKVARRCRGFCFFHIRTNHFPSDILKEKENRKKKKKVARSD